MMRTVGARELDIAEGSNPQYPSQMMLTVGAGELDIAHGSNPQYWKYTSDPDSRFAEVAKLDDVCWLDVSCKVKAGYLSPKTSYGAYFIFKLANNSYGLESVRGVVRFCDHEARADYEKRASLLHLQQDPENKSLVARETGRLASCREDGWMEIELGDLFITSERDGEVEARLLEIRQLQWKSGLIVEAIEFRPKISF